MAFLDILRGRKREEVKPERLPKGAFSPKANQPVAEKYNNKKFAKKSAKKEEQNQKEEKSASISPKIQTNKSGFAGQILIKPHITERATELSRQNVYTFHVAPAANKILVKKAIKEMYGFEAIRIRIINTAAKTRKTRGKIGVKSGIKKAMVYLKESDKIEFI